MKNVVVPDNIEAMKLLKDESIHLTLRHHITTQEIIHLPKLQTLPEFLADVFKEVHRITKEGRF